MNGFKEQWIALFVDKESIDIFYVYITLFLLFYISINYLFYICVFKT